MYMIIHYTQVDNSNFSKVKFSRCVLARIRDFYNEPTLQEMKFSMKDLFSKNDQIHRKLQICSHLLRNP